MRLPFLFLSITSIFFRFLSKKFVYMLFIFIETINAMKRKKDLSLYRCDFCMKSMLNYSDFVLIDNLLTEL